MLEQMMNLALIMLIFAGCYYWYVHANTTTEKAIAVILMILFGAGIFTHTFTRL